MDNTGQELMMLQNEPLRLAAARDPAGLFS